jgi:hypothetical protein
MIQIVYESDQVPTRWRGPPDQVQGAVTDLSRHVHVAPQQTRNLVINAIEFGT